MGACAVAGMNTLSAREARSLWHCGSRSRLTGVHAANWSAQNTFIRNWKQISWFGSNFNWQYTAWRWPSSSEWGIISYYCQTAACCKIRCHHLVQYLLVIFVGKPGKTPKSCHLYFEVQLYFSLRHCIFSLNHNCILKPGIVNAFLLVIQKWQDIVIIGKYYCFSCFSKNVTSSSEALSLFALWSNVKQGLLYRRTKTPLEEL